MSAPSLITCHACKGQVSNQAPACPRCGQPTSVVSGQLPSQQVSGQPTPTLFQQYQQEPPPKKKSSCLAGCLVVFLIFIVLGTIIQIFTGPRTNSDTKNSSVGNVTPSRSVLSDPAVVERVRRGEQLFKRLKSPPPNPLITGDLMDYPAVTILVRKDRWDKLSKAEQVDLTYYAESLVLDARNNPGKYITMPSSAPLYRGVEGKVRSLCGECWAVGVTFPSPDVKGEDTFDRVVLGDVVWGQNKSSSRASEFRWQG